MATFSIGFEIVGNLAVEAKTSEEARAIFDRISAEDLIKAGYDDIRVTSLVEEWPWRQRTRKSA